MSGSPPNGRIYRILVVTPSEKLASFQIGIRQPFDELKRRKAVEYRVHTELTATEQDVADAELVVFLRNTTPAALRLMNRARALGRGTVYSIDDHFLHLPPDRGFGIAMQEPERRDAFVQLMRRAKAVRVGSPYFAEQIRREYNRNVVCIEAGVDFDWIDRAGRKTRSDRYFTIGYQGSFKEDDFADVVPALRELLAKYPQVTLEFHGYAPARLLGHPQVVYFAGGHDYKPFLQLLARRAWDVGLAPLEDHLYNRCKSNNKFREYSACGIPGIYSDMPTYSYCVTNGETGLLVPHTKAGWYEGIERMIKDDALRGHIREQAGRAVRERYTIAECARRWLDLVQTTAGRKGSN